MCHHLRLLRGAVNQEKCTLIKISEDAYRYNAEESISGCLLAHLPPHLVAISASSLILMFTAGGMIIKFE